MATPSSPWDVVASEPTGGEKPKTTSPWDVTSSEGGAEAPPEETLKEPLQFHPPKPGEKIPGTSLLGGLPGPPKAPLPEALSKQPPPIDPRASVWSNYMRGALSGDDLLSKLINLPREGGAQFVRGAEQTSTGKPRDIAGGTSEMIRGGGKAIAPVALPLAVVTAPVSTAVGIGTGMAAGLAAEAGGKKLGLAPEYVNLLSDIANTVAGGLGPKGVSALLNRLKVQPNLSTAAADAVKWADDNKIPISAYVRTGLERIRQWQQKSAGTGVAQESQAATQAALKQQPQKIAGAPMEVPEAAGAGTRQKLEATQTRHGTRASQSYTDLETLEAANQQQVVTGHQTQTVTNAQGQPLLDAQGNPITRSVPIVETIGMPVDMATAKQSLTPLRARLIEEMSEADMKSSRGLKALDTVLEGPDYLPASVADKKLGAIKALLREKGVNDRTKYFAEQALTALDPLIDKAVATGGPKATQALQEGRLFTKAKYATRQTLKELPEEPIGVFQKLTRPGDAGINLLRDVQTHAPDAMPAVGRAYMQGLFDTALGEAGKPPNTKLAISNWAKLGDATKKILFSADQIKSIDRFLKLSDIEASVPSTASAAPRNWLGSLAVNVLPETLMMGAGHLAHYPKLGVEAGLGYAGLRGIWALGSRGMANLLWNPANARMVTEGIRLPSMPGAIGATTAKGAIEYARGGTILDRQPSRQQVLNSLRGYADGGVADDGTIYLGDRPGEFYNRLQLGPRVQAIRSTNRPMGTIQSEPPVMPVGPSLKDVQIGAQQGASDWARMLFKPSEAIYGRVPLASGKTLSEAATGMVGPDPREVEARQSPTSQGLQFLGRMPFDIPRYGMMTAAAGGNPMLGMAAADALGAETPWGAVKQGATGAAMGKGMELGMHGLAQVPGYVRENVLPGLRDVISSRPATTFAREQLEAVPGRVTGHLPGMTDLPFNERDYFTRQAMGAFEDPRGRDILQAATGLPTAPMEPMIGSFKEPGKPWDVNPGRSLAAEVPVEWTPKEGGGFTPRLPADVQANLRGTAGVHGAMLGQAGVGIPALVPQKAGRSFRMELPETPPLTPEAMTTLSKTYPEYAMAHTGTGIEALDISDLNLSPLQRANAAKIVNAAKTINADNIGDYIDYSDAWAKKPGSGEVTRQMLGYIDAMKPEQQAALDQAVRQPAGDLYKLYEQTAQSKKLPVRRDLMNLLTVMRDKGIPGVREGIKSGAFLPGLVGAVLLPSLFRGTSEPSGQAGPI